MHSHKTTFNDKIRTSIAKILYPKIQILYPRKSMSMAKSQVENEEEELTYIIYILLETHILYKMSAKSIQKCQSYMVWNLEEEEKGAEEEEEEEEEKEERYDPQYFCFVSSFVRRATYP